MFIRGWCFSALCIYSLREQVINEFGKGFQYERNVALIWLVLACQKKRSIKIYEVLCTLFLLLLYFMTPVCYFMEVSSRKLDISLLIDLVPCPLIHIFFFSKCSAEILVLFNDACGWMWLGSHTFISRPFVCWTRSSRLLDDRLNTWCDIEPNLFHPIVAEVRKFVVLLHIFLVAVQLSLFTYFSHAFASLILIPMSCFSCYCMISRQFLFPTYHYEYCVHVYNYMWHVYVMYMCVCVVYMYTWHVRHVHVYVLLRRKCDLTQMWSINT